MTWPLLTPSQALAAYPAGHPLHELARMLAHLAEHPAVADVWLSDPPPDLEREVWVSVRLRDHAPVRGDLLRFAERVAARFGWRLCEVAHIGWPTDAAAQWVIIWDPAPA